MQRSIERAISRGAWAAPGGARSVVKAFLHTGFSEERTGIPSTGRWAKSADIDPLPTSLMRADCNGKVRCREHLGGSPQGYGLRV
jgi:hypothetical protein